MRQLLESVPEFSIAGETDNGKEAVALVRQHRPDVAILDISMPEMSGIEAAKIIKENNPETKILILTIHDDQDYVVQVMQAGADGYIIKNSSPEDIIEAVRCVAAGQEYLGQGVSSMIAEKFIRGIKEASGEYRRKLPHLTKREVEILRYVTQGLTSKEISDKLSLSVRTVHSHRMNIMQKLNIHETAGLVTYAVKHGLVKLD
ncbi:MAG TPA: response regulator transcription factor [Bacteroidota bacterium]|nr:response regulator transcription factor [Bacteroidota bacterium]